MKRVLAGTLILGLVVALFAAPTPAFADGRHHFRPHRGGGYFVGGLALGALTGVVIGSLVAPRPVYATAPTVVYEPAPVVVQPAPVVAVPPAPVCTDYWVPDGYRGGVWVQGHWERACR